MWRQYIYRKAMGISYSDYLEEPAHVTDWNLAFMKAEDEAQESKARKLKAQMAAKELSGRG